MTAVGDSEYASLIVRAKRARSIASHRHPAWPLIVAQALALGWPKAFEADLWVHDRAALAARGDVRDRFLWCVGAHGTHVVWFGHAGDVDMPRSKARDLADTLAECRPRMFEWDGCALREVDKDRLCEILANGAPKAAKETEQWI